MIRLEPRVVEFHHVFARHFFDARRRSRARHRVSIRVPFAIEERRKHAQAHLYRRRFLALDSSDLQSLLALEVFLRKSRIQNHVCVKFKRRIELRFKRREPHNRQIQIRERANLRAQQRLLVADLQRGSRFCAAV